MRCICIQKGGKCYFYLASGTCPLYKTEPQTFDVISFQITVNQNVFVYLIDYCSPKVLTDDWQANRKTGQKLNLQKGHKNWMRSIK